MATPHSDSIGGAFHVSSSTTKFAESTTELRHKTFEDVNEIDPSSISVPYVATCGCLAISRKAERHTDAPERDRTAACHELAKCNTTR